MIPFTLELDLIETVSISVVITKRPGDNWPPCLTPLVKMNPSDVSISNPSINVSVNNFYPFN